ncbi:MAG: trimethylamine methyltransferase family protein [Bacillota bacterium]|nr:trimethylamine methyltransferase family protein [Bacillota bacterium]
MLLDMNTESRLRLTTLTPNQLQKIHLASCKVLEQGGMVIHHEEALELLKEAKVPLEGNRAYFPTSLVEWAIRTAPSRYTVYDRNGNSAMYLEDSKVHYGVGSDTLNYLDPQTGERRKWTKTDVAAGITICDYLPNIDFVMSMGLLSDVNRKMINREQFAIMLQNTTKPQVVIAEDGPALADIIKMAAVVAGGVDNLKRKPTFLLYVEPTSPLQHPTESLDKLLLAAEYGIPTNFACGGVAGGTTPVTVAGAIVQANAEALSGLVIHQLKNPGAPFLYGYGNSPLDMRTMQAVYGAPEAILLQGGLCDLARYYQLPSWGYAGCSNAKVCDEQAVMEATNFTLMGTMQGCNVMHDVFYMEFGLTGSLELLVIGDEIISRAKRMVRGIDTDEDHLGVEAILRVGPYGNFMGDEHTVQHFKENWHSDLSDFNTYENWTAGGSLTMVERARKKIDKILNSHKPEELDQEKRIKIEEILAEARKSYGEI